MSNERSPTRPDAVKSDEEWKERLTPDQYHVTREHGAGPPFTRPWLENKQAGNYRCVCCGASLFDAGAKFDSGAGWPSFFRPVSDDAIAEHEDRALMMRRIEARCAQCEAHLGHVFPDGPARTGLRHCMNGSALDFEPRKQ